jgi:hypothetical protein
VRRRACGGQLAAGSGITAGRMGARGRAGALEAGAPFGARAGGGGGGVIAKSPMQLVRANYAWPLLSPRAKRSRRGVPTGESPRGSPQRGSPAAQAAGAGGRCASDTPLPRPEPKGMWPASESRTAHSPLRPKGMRLRSIFLDSPPCVWRLQLAKRACVLGAGVRVHPKHGFKKHGNGIHPTNLFLI